MLLTVEPQFCCLPKASDDAHFPCRCWSRDALHVLQQSKRRLQRTYERERDEKKKENKERPGVNDALFQGRIRTRRAASRVAVHSIRVRCRRQGDGGLFVSRSYLSSASLLARTGWIKNRASPCSPDKITERYRLGLRSVQSSGGRHNNSPLDLRQRKRRNLTGLRRFGVSLRILGHPNKQTVHSTDVPLGEVGAPADERSSRAVQMQCTRCCENCNATRLGMRNKGLLLVIAFVSALSNFLG